MARKKYTGKRHQTQAIFKTRPELDFIVQIALGAAVSEGAAVGEVFYAVSRIDEKDPESWVQEWTALGERVEKIAAEAQSQGNKISSRGAHLRAFNYFRTASYCLRFDDPQLEKIVCRFRNNFKQASRLFDPPIDTLKISSSGLTLPGYFMPAPNQDSARPTLVFIVGGESYCEEALLYSLAGARSRGYNVLTLDLPGQGATVHQGMIYRPDVEKFLSAAIDQIITRREVDSERIVAHGVSYGGYAVARAAAYDQRLVAISASTPILDFQQMINEGWGFMAKLPAFSGKVAIKLLGTYDPLSLIVLEKFFKSAGLKNPAELPTLFIDWRVDPEMIQCPVMVMVGEGESQAFQNQAYQAYRSIQGPTTMRVFTVEEGADAHTQGNNFPLAFQTVFDWYDEVFRKSQLS